LCVIVDLRLLKISRRKLSEGWTLNEGLVRGIGKQVYRLWKEGGSVESRMGLVSLLKVHKWSS